MYCKYDGAKLIFRTPRKTKRAGTIVLRLVCPQCGELFLASDEPNSHPYQTHPNRLAVEDRTQVYSVRISPREIADIRNGKARLTISDSRLQLQYNT